MQVLFVTNANEACVYSKCFGGFWGIFGGWGGPIFFSKFWIQSRMILVNTIPNPKSVAPKKLLSRKVSMWHIDERTNDTKFRRDKNRLKGVPI